MKYTEIYSHTSDFLLCILFLCMLSNRSLQKFGIVEEFQQRTLTETITENLALAFAMVSEIQSAFHKLILSLLLPKGESKIIMVSKYGQGCFSEGLSNA